VRLLGKDEKPLGKDVGLLSKSMKHSDKKV
jgi:hypothetical protein